MLTTSLKSEAPTVQTLENPRSLLNFALARARVELLNVSYARPSYAKQVEQASATLAQLERLSLTLN